MMKVVTTEVGQTVIEIDESAAVRSYPATFIKKEHIARDITQTESTRGHNNF